MRLIDADALLNDSSIVYHTEFGDAVVDVEDIKKAPTIKTFTLADIEEQYRKGLERGLEAETKKCIERIEGRLWKTWGNWIVSEVRCPECLEYFDTDCYSKEEMDKCQNCGADMRPKEGEAE